MAVGLMQVAVMKTQVEVLNDKFDAMHEEIRDLRRDNWYLKKGKHPDDSEAYIADSEKLESHQQDK